MNCNNNGRTFIDFLTLVPGGTAEDATYQIALTHYCCGNRKVCTSEALPISASLQFQALGTPRSLGNDTYCCDVLCTGTCTYMPYRCGCQCDSCPITDNIYCTMCVPCPSAGIPTITAGTAVAMPTNVQACCNVTNAIGINCSFNVATEAA